MKIGCHHVYLLICLAHGAMLLAQGAEPLLDQYILVERVPRAITETPLPMPGAGIAYCAKACHAKRDTCQGFHIVSGEPYPCVLLEELTGMTDDPSLNLQAFLNTYFEGTRHQYWTMLSHSWDQGILDCQSAGMTMVSYPKSEKELSWMNAFNPGLLHIGAMKDPLDPDQVYDINTNELVVVDWELGPGEPASNIVVLMAGSKQFGRAKPYSPFPKTGLLCSEVN